ncbi:MAG: DUF1015 domain-containing protein [Bacteroidetes bacterium]|nr:DUF1015 domain-containing protein [Bacteroidota bacterium]
MNTAKVKLANVGILLPEIIIPKKCYDLHKWAVVACDQYTSEPAYWEDVASFVGKAPSTLKLTFPEVYLGNNDDDRINVINKTMTEYINNDIFDIYSDSFFLINRKSANSSANRWGLIAALDLEKYDYSNDSISLIRATEGTILDRIPPRKHIRKKAPLELPHILVLIDDPDKTVLEPLVNKKESLEIVYSTELMKNGGGITAYRVSDEKFITEIANALTNLANPENFKKKYNSTEVLLYAMGDGNHSLATAKSCWEDLKTDSKFSSQDLNNHPARYALVEIENIFDPGIVFEPIHRVLFSGNKKKFFTELSKFCDNYEIKKIQTLDEMQNTIKESVTQEFGLSDASGLFVVTMHSPSAKITAGTVQLAIDAYLQVDEKAEIDYTHGAQITFELSQKNSNFGIFLPPISKEEFFPAIIHDGALPRKTFSMGEAQEKRYYIEARKITL